MKYNFYLIVQQPFEILGDVESHLSHDLCAILCLTCIIRQLSHNLCANLCLTYLAIWVMTCAWTFSLPTMSFESSPVWKTLFDLLSHLSHLLCARLSITYLVISVIFCEPDSVRLTSHLGHCIASLSICN